MVYWGRGLLDTDAAIGLTLQEYAETYRQLQRYPQYLSSDPKVFIRHVDA